MKAFVRLGLAGSLACMNTPCVLAQVRQPSFAIQPSSTTYIPAATTNVVYPVFSVESGTSCPTPALNVQGFGGNTDNSSSYADRYGSSGSYGNYGFAAGVSIPFSSGLLQWCKRAAAAKAKKAELDTWTILFNNCAYLKTNGIEIDAFPGLPEEYKKCKYVRVAKVSLGPPETEGLVEPRARASGLSIERFTPQQGGTLQLVP
jgi:hypothetical protein